MPALINALAINDGKDFKGLSSYWGYAIVCCFGPPIVLHSLTQKNSLELGDLDTTYTGDGSTSYRWLDFPL